MHNSLYFSKLALEKGAHLDSALAEHFSDIVILYRKRMGFGVPVEEWLRKDLKDYGGDMALNGAASRQFLEAPMLGKFWNEHQSGLRTGPRNCGSS